MHLFSPKFIPILLTATPHNPEGNPLKTTESCFQGVSNENKERVERSVSKRRQATIFSEDHEVGSHPLGKKRLTITRPIVFFLLF